VLTAGAAGTAAEELRGAQNSQYLSQSHSNCRLKRPYAAQPHTRFTDYPGWPQQFQNIFLRERRPRGLKTSLVKICHLCRARAEPAAGVSRVLTPLCLLGGNLGFSSAFFKQVPPAFGRQKAPSPHVGAFRTAIKLRLYYFIILF